MKKTLLLLLTSILFFSCKKESEIIKHQTGYTHYRSPSDTTAIAYFAKCAALGSSTDSLHQILIENLIMRLKSEMGANGSTSQFNSLDYLVLLTEHKGAALVNILDTSIVGTIVNDYATSHTYCKGFTGKNSVLFRIDTRYNPFDGLRSYKFGRNDNCFGVYSNTNKREVCGLMSNLDASQNGYELKSHTSGVNCINGNSTSFATHAIDCTGGMSSKRTSSTSCNAYKNAKTDIANSTVATSATVNKSFKLFIRDVGGVYSLGSGNRLAFAYAGSSNVNIQKLERAIIEEYLKPIGGAITKLVVLDGNSFISNADIGTKLIDKLWLNGVECTTLYNGVSGVNFSTMITNLPTKVAAYKESYFDKEVYLFHEISNTLKGSTSTVSGTWTQMQTYVAAVKGYGFQNVCLSTCLPFKTLVPAKRRNPSNINDTLTINGLIINRYNTVLNADYITNPGNDTTTSVWVDSYGVAGVGEKNTTYFNTDEQHLNGTGASLFVNNYLYPMIYSILH